MRNSSRRVRRINAQRTYSRAIRVSAFGSFGLTRYNNQISQARANIARINAQMMMRQYEQTLRANEKDVAQKTMAAGRVKHSQRASLAANGVAVGEGSAAELQASTDLIKEIDVNQMNENALREAWGYRMQGANYNNQALSHEAQKQNKWDVFGATLLGGASQVSTNYMLMASTGMFDKSPKSKSTDLWLNYAGSKKYGFAVNSRGWGSYGR